MSDYYEGFDSYMQALNKLFKDQTILSSLNKKSEIIEIVNEIFSFDLNPSIKKEFIIDLIEFLT